MTERDKLTRLSYFFKRVVPLRPLQVMGLPLYYFHVAQNESNSRRILLVFNPPTFQFDLYSSMLGEPKGRQKNNRIVALKLPGLCLTLKGQSLSAKA